MKISRMNTTPIIKITAEGPEVGVNTARLLLKHALKKEKQSETDEDPDLARKRAINELTGASIFLPPSIVPVGESVDQSKRIDPTINPLVSFSDNQP